MKAIQATPTRREVVLETLKGHPYATARDIADLTGFTYDSVKNHLNQLEAGEVIHSVALDREVGSSLWIRKAYCYGLSADMTAARSKEPPKQWDVLAYFFGRIAEPAAA